MGTEHIKYCDCCKQKTSDLHIKNGKELCCKCINLKKYKTESTLPNNITDEQLDTAISNIIREYYKSSGNWLPVCIMKEIAKREKKNYHYYYVSYLDKNRCEYKQAVEYNKIDEDSMAVDYTVLDEDLGDCKKYILSDDPPHPVVLPHKNIDCFYEKDDDGLIRTLKEILKDKSIKMNLVISFEKPKWSFKADKVITISASDGMINLDWLDSINTN